MRLLNRILWQLLRKVGSIKKSIKKARLTYKEMETALVKLEGVINCRPLTYLREEDIQDPITPSHLICGRNLNTQTEYQTANYVNLDLGTRAKYVTQVIDMFWNRFSRSYLTTLREFHMYNRTKNRTNEKCTSKEGDVVMVKGKLMPRTVWRAAVVENL